MIRVGTKVITTAAVAGIPAVPEVNHVETVVDAAAYDETVVDVAAHDVFHAEVNHVVHHAAVTHTETVIDVPAIPATPGTPAQTHQDYEAGHVHAKEVHGFAPHDFIYNFHKYQIVGNQAEQAFIVHGYFCAHKAHLVTIIDVPAVPGTPAVPAHYHTVCHAAVTHEITVTDGVVVDVTEQVKEAVSQGHFQFRFNNAMNPGGIVNPEQTAVYVQINDPAFGFVKDVTITYTGRFEPSVRTIEVHEYDLVDLQ